MLGLIMIFKAMASTPIRDFLLWWRLVLDRPGAELALGPLQ